MADEQGERRGGDAAERQADTADAPVHGHHEGDAQRAGDGERTTAALVAEHGLLSVTMSRIAGETGIGRATLYEYFPDVQAILADWDERQVDDVPHANA